MVYFSQQSTHNIEYIYISIAQFNIRMLCQQSLEYVD